MAMIPERSMAKKAGRPASGSPWNVGKAVRLDASLASMARAVAIHRGVTIGEYLEPMFAASVRRDYAAMLRELDASQPPPDQPADAPARPSRRKPKAP